MTRRATIRDVARRAGVSIGTVSNVLTGQRAVRDATREAVEAAIRELRYVPDVTARSLIGRRGSATRPIPSNAPHLHCVGYVCADQFVQIDRFPERGSRTFARTIERRLGGRAANVAVAAAGLGPPYDLAVDLLSVLGEESESDWAAATLAARRVVLAPGTRDPAGSLSRAVILLDATGSRTIVNERLQVDPARLADLLARIEAAPSRRHAVFVQGSQAAALEAAIGASRASGVALDWVTQIGGADARGDVEGWRGRLRLFDVAILNDGAARALCGAAGDGSMREVAALAPTVALTMGPQGAILFQGGEEVARAPAPPVEAIDETGAGDAFAGAFLAAWLHGSPPRVALEFGVAAGARAMGDLGAQECILRAGDLASAPE